MAKEVLIQLTPAQKAKIKRATGKSLSEIRVSSLGKNVAVMPGQKTARFSEDIEQSSLRAEESLRAGGDEDI